MQKKLYFIGIILSCFLFLSASSVFAETILDFHSDITIQEDSSFLVKETIVYDFGTLQRHGIYRDIPLGDTSIKIQKVLDENDAPYEYTTLRQGADLRIKIGNANALISGVHTYNIFYSVSNGLRFFNDHDELYQNITGNGWLVPIKKSSAEIHLPQALSDEVLQYACFAGGYGSKTENCNWSYDGQGNVIFESTEIFNPGEGLTIVLGWPKGVVKESFFNHFIVWFKKFWPIFIPIFTFIYLFRKWRKEGKDLPLKGPVIAQYEPPDNLRPLEVALLLNQKVKPADIPALIVDLAVRGYIKIKEIEKTGFFGKKDYLIIRVKDFDGPQNDLQEYERDFLKSLFSESIVDAVEIFSKFFIKKGYLSKTKLPNQESKILDEVAVSSLKEKFYIKINLLIRKISSEMASIKGYFTADPQKTISKWSGFGIIVLVFAFMLFTILGQNLIQNPSQISLIILLASTALSVILFFVFAQFMPKKTVKGIEAYWVALGFKEYINTAEKYRIQFQEKENIFEEFLPYAMIFGLAEKWGKAFEGIYKTPPSWYEGNFGPTFNAAIFASAISNNFNAIGATMNARPGGGGSGFGGGGFAGGGGGGGGGGSW